jgi:hypothetical protein
LLAGEARPRIGVPSDRDPLVVMMQPTDVADLDHATTIDGWISRPWGLSISRAWCVRHR